MGALFEPLAYEHRAGAWTGPLVLVADGGTASATEQFISVLQANHAATLVGQRTHGSGCGYTNGGVPVDLESMDLRVWMPDCVRYLADGTNEVAGIEPEIRVPWEGKDGRSERTKKLIEALAQTRRASP